MNAIDTNILVYTVDQNEIIKRGVAKELVRRLQHESDTLLMWQVLAEYARWLTSGRQAPMLTRGQIREYLQNIRAGFPLAMPTPAVLDIALDLAERYSLSHWDSMLLGACVDAGVTTLYTEDIGAPRKIDSLELVNPF